MKNYLNYTTKLFLNKLHHYCVNPYMKSNNFFKNTKNKSEAS